MNIEQFKKLENEMKQQNFSNSYGRINKILFYLSIFGNFASIFCAYFFLSKLLQESVTAITNAYVIGFIAIMILSALELLKREIFDKFSVEYVKVKSFAKKNVAILTLFTIMIISLSFYSSLRGAHEFSSKNKVLETEKKEIINTFSDSLNTFYGKKIADIEADTKTLKEKIDNKDKEQTELEGSQPLTYQQRNRIRDLKKEKEELKSDIKTNDVKISDLQTELKTKLDEHKTEIEKDTKVAVKENESNSFIFLFISTIIELLILIGIYFNKFYRQTTYEEYKQIFYNDPNFQKWQLFNGILDIIFVQNIKINDKIPSANNIHELCKINALTANLKEVGEALKLFAQLKILKVAGPVRYVNMDKNNSTTALKQHFKID